MKKKLQDLLLIFSCIAEAVGGFLFVVFLFLLMCAVAAYVAVGIFNMLTSK